MKRQRWKGLASGLLLSAFGVAWAWGTATGPLVQDLGDLATTADPLPLVAGVSIAFVGALITACALDHRRHADSTGMLAASIPWRALWLSVGANVFFGILLGGLPGIGLPPMGLLVAVYALAFLAGLASDQLHPQGVLRLAVAVALGCALAAVGAQAALFPLWPTFLVG